jgi:hypothetical protein
MIFQIKNEAKSKLRILNREIEEIEKKDYY